MNDKLFKFKDVEPNKVETEAVSLVISDVPSKVAYDILMTALATGEDLSPEAIQEKVEKRINGPVAQVTFSEFLQSCYGTTRFEKVVEDIPTHFNYEHWLEKMFGEDIIREEPPTNSGKEMEDEGRSL